MIFRQEQAALLCRTKYLADPGNDRINLDVAGIETWFLAVQIEDDLDLGPENHLDVINAFTRYAPL